MQAEKVTKIVGQMASGTIPNVLAAKVGLIVGP